MKFKSARRFVRCTAMLLIAIASTVAVAATNPVPLIEQPLLPQNAVPGGAGFTVTVKGAGFVNGAVLNWNGSARPTSFVSSTKLTASVTAADVANAGTATVTVTNPVPGGGSSNPVFFQVTDPVVSIQTAATWKSATLLDAGMVTADFNQDGKPDVAVINCGTDLLCEHDVNSIDVYLGDGHGALTTGPSTVIPNSSLIPKLSLTGDFNGDGKIDVAVGTFYCVDIFLGDGTGAFTLASTFGSQAELPVILSLGAGDFNRDGNLDLLVGTNSDQSVHFASGDGTGHFTLSGKTAGFAAGLVVGTSTMTASWILLSPTPT